MKKLLQIIFNSRFIFLINFLEKFVFFIFFLVLARQLDKSSYGLVTTVFAFCNIVNSFFDFGVGFYIQRESGKAEIDKEISAGVSLKVIGILFFSTIVLAYLYIYLGINIYIISVIGALTYLNGFNMMLNSYLYGRRKYRKSYYAFLISRGLFLAVIVYFFVTRTGSYYILLALFFSVILHLILLYYVTSEEGLKLKMNLNKESVKSIVMSSLPFGIGSIFVMMYDKTDVLIIERIINLESVAIYSIAYSLYKLPHILSNIILTPVYTDFSHSFRNNNGIRKSEIAEVSLVLFIISFISIAVIFFFGEKILIILYGAKYLPSVIYFKVLIFALPALYFNNLTGVISNSVKKEKIPMMVNGVGVLLNIILNITGILLFGIWGAVFATIITEYLVFLLQAGMLRNHNISAKFILQY